MGYRKKTIDYSALSRILSLKQVNDFATVEVPQMTVNHWSYLQDLSINEAISEIDKELNRWDFSTQEIIKEKSCFWHVGAFAHYYFEEEMSLPFGQHHDVFFQCIKRGSRDKHINILAPRGCGKSTCMARIYPLHCIFYKETYKMLGLPEDNFILITSYAFMQAKDHIVAIRNKIESDKRFQHLEGLEEWGANGLKTANGVYVVPFSVGKSIRGALKGTHRPTLIIKDDVDATDTVRNPEQREKAREWHDKSLLPAGRAGYTNTISIDTLKHPEALAYLLSTRPNVETTHLRAIMTPEKIYHPEHEDLWEEWAKIYADMSVDSNVREARSTLFFEENRDLMLDGIEELWPDGLTYLQVRKYIVERGYPFVMQEYQNDISSSDEFIFDMTRASRFKIIDDGFLRGDNILIPWDDMAGATVFLDWSGTKSDTKNNCYAAITTVVWVPQARNDIKGMSHLAKSNAYVYSAWIERGTGATQYRALLDQADEIRSLLLSKITRHDARINVVQEGFVDTTGFVKPGALHMFNSVRKQRDYKEHTLQFLSRAGADEKHTRIRLLQAPFDNKWLHFNEQLPAEYERQLSLFPTADYDDAPDSLEGACSLKFAVLQGKVQLTPAEKRTRTRQAQQRRRV